MLNLVSLITSRLGIGLFALALGYLAGHRAASNGDLVNSLRLSVALQEAAANKAEQETASLQEMEKTLKGQVDAYRAEIDKRGGNSCRLMPSDVKRMRQFK